jgi:hypothetical protein
MTIDHAGKTLILIITGTDMIVIMATGIILHQTDMAITGLTVEIEDLPIVLQTRDGDTHISQGGIL